MKVVIDEYPTTVVIADVGIRGDTGDVTPEAIAARDAAQSAATSAQADAVAAAQSAADAAAAFPGLEARVTDLEENPAFPDAPDDGGAYIRVNGQWVQLYAPLALAGDLPDGTVDEPYSATLEASGGRPPYTLGDVLLPPGLDATLSDTSVTVAGTPSEEWGGEAHIDLSDSLGTTIRRVFGMDVVDVPYIGGTVPPPWSWSAGGERIDIAFIGDSVTVGASAGNPGGGEATFAALGHVGLLRAELQARHGDGGVGFVGLRTGNGFWTRAGTWTRKLTHGPFFESYQATGAANTATLVIPDGDNVDLFFARMAGFGQFTYSVDGGADVAGPPVGVADEGTSRLNIPLGAGGAHTVVVKAPASGTVDLIGAAIYKGSTGLVVHNFSKSGIGAVVATGGASVAIAPAAMPKLWGVLQHIQPRLTAVNFLINDHSAQNNPTALYGPLMRVVTDYCAGFGDVMTWQPPGLQSDALPFPIASYEAQSKLAAEGAGGFWLDVHTAWGPYSSNAGRMWDSVHPNTQGHADMAALFLRLFEKMGA